MSFRDALPYSVERSRTRRRVGVSAVVFLTAALVADLTGSVPAAAAAPSSVTPSATTIAAPSDYFTNQWNDPMDFNNPEDISLTRLNFNEVRRVPTDEKRAKWEQYQALPEQERERLASDRPKPPVTIAPALRPTPPSAISRPVRAASSPPEDASRGLRINVPLNRNTLLPLAPAPEGAGR